MNRAHKQPGPDHPIELTLVDRPARILAGGHEIAAAERYVLLDEGGYPEVVYIPREGIDDGLIERSKTKTWCPYKGEASYFHIRLPDGARIEDALWSYEDPFAAVAAIAGHVAADPEKVDAISADERPATPDAPNTF